MLNSSHRLGKRTRRLARAASAAAVLATVGLPATAAADYTVDGGVYCKESISQVFEAFGDWNWYALAPSGDFEHSVSSWSQRRGAEVVAGSDPFAITGKVGKYSMSLPDGGSVTSPPVCVDPTRETFRFVLRNTSSDRARIKVEAIFENGSKSAGSYLVGYVSTPVGVWEPSPILRNAASRFVEWGTTSSVEYRFTAENGSMVIDDVHVDPRWSW